MEIEDLVKVSKQNINNKGYERISKLQEFFTEKYSSKPEFFVRVPGRVNLIGEHVDYSGYAVCPMAISQCILLSVSKSDSSEIHIKNIESGKYGDFQCSIDDINIEQPAPGQYPKWYNYILCGIKGILDYLDKLGQHHNRQGFYLAVSGNIPPASGLSSSSALVCSAALAAAYLFDIPLNRKLLATLSASSEKFIGTQGGGMDQAIAFLARKGCAQLIEFNPIRATPIKLPSSVVFVIANSMSEANKAATSDFNIRVVECKIATKLLCLWSGFVQWQDVHTLHQLQNEVLKIDLEQFEALIKHKLTKDIYTKDELMTIFSINSSDFEKFFATSNTKNVKEFKLRQRALHVIQESIRVKKFCEIASSNASHENESDKVAKLSELMLQSHESLDTLFQCSHPNLNKLIDISLQHGVSARLTGAGWGGCIVALTDSTTSCKNYMSTLANSYFSQVDDSKLSNVIFATEPQDGAEIFLVD